MNETPSTTVRKRPRIACDRFPSMIAWCAQVQVAPELLLIKVFNKGTPQGEKHSIPFGGQTDPISGTGAKADQKKAQKKAKTNISV